MNMGEEPVRSGEGRSQGWGEEKMEAKLVRTHIHMDLTVKQHIQLTRVKCFSKVRPCCLSQVIPVNLTMRK